MMYVVNVTILIYFLVIFTVLFVGHIALFVSSSIVHFTFIEEGSDIFKQHLGSGLLHNFIFTFVSGAIVLMIAALIYALLDIIISVTGEEIRKVNLKIKDAEK